MRVFILGMHRSGTSLLSRVMHELGLFVGEPSELMPAQPCNVEGFWERLDVSALDEQLLELAGGSWDCPPPVRTLEKAWLDSTRGSVRAASVRANEILERLDRAGSWSVKDPRASLTWPLWRRLVPDARIVVAVRDPFEVAASLVARHGCTETLGLALWRAYNEAILRFTHAEERTVVAYDRLLSNPRAETQRVASALGLDVASAQIEAASRVAAPPLRTQRSVATARRLEGARFAATRRIYERLLAEAGPSATSVLEGEPWPLGSSVDVAMADRVFDAFTRGWSEREPQGVWTDGVSATLTIGPLPIRARRAARLRLTVVPFIATPCTKQRIRIQSAGKTLYEAELSEPRLHELDFVTELPERSSWLTLDISLPDATSPARAGTGEDVRTLGLLLTSVRVERDATRKT
jgi:hypothetical protein